MEREREREKKDFEWHQKVIYHKDSTLEPANFSDFMSLSSQRISVKYSLYIDKIIICA